MGPTGRLTHDFAQRMVADLATNNVLRGSWAEQLVAHFLSIEALPPNWSYFDMRDPCDHDISVKHSVGPRAKFSVEMSRWAWDPKLAEQHPAIEGWLGGETAEMQYWCHAYVFAWLDAGSSAPPLEGVLDSEQWRFAALSRAEMHRSFVRGKVLPQKSVGVGTLKSLTSFVPGPELASLMDALDFEDHEDVPVRHMEVAYRAKPGVPVETAVEVLPEAVADEPHATVDVAADLAD